MTRLNLERLEKDAKFGYGATAKTTLALIKRCRAAEARVAALRSPAEPRPPCAFCKDTGWVNDENWEPPYPELPEARAPGSGLIPCSPLICTAPFED